eukprot:1158495-Pelagomonas_calceolata.AAC.13
MHSLPLCLFPLTLYHRGHVATARGGGIVLAVSAACLSCTACPFASSHLLFYFNDAALTLQPEKESNVLAVSEALPKGMRRPVWSLNDFIVIKKLHQVRRFAPSQPSICTTMFVRHMLAQAGH